MMETALRHRWLRSNFKRGGGTIVAVAVAIRDAIYRGRIRTAEEALDAWRCHSEVAPEFEIILRECVSALLGLDDVEKECWALLRSGKMDTLLECGRRLGNAIELGSRMARRASDCAQKLEEMGYTLDSATDFRKCVMKLEAIRRRFASWPFPKKEDMDKAIAEIERGEGIELGHWIASLQNETHSAVGASHD
jgi:hypothetical protein